MTFSSRWTRWRAATGPKPEPFPDEGVLARDETNVFPLSNSTSIRAVVARAEPRHPVQIDRVGSVDPLEALGIDPSQHPFESSARYDSDNMSPRAMLLRRP